MDTSDGGRSPTVDQLVEQVRQWLAANVTLDEAAARLAKLAPSRAILQDMDTRWLQMMAQLRSDDFAAEDVLQVIEAALRLVPRPAIEY